MPALLTPKQYSAAMLLATMHSPTEAAEQLKVKPSTISSWCKLPAMQQQIEQYRERMFARLAGKTVEEVMADAPNTFRRLREHRDQTEDAKISLGACRELFARQVPAKTVHDESRTIRIILEQKDEAHARAVLAEARTIDVTPPTE